MRCVLCGPVKGTSVSYFEFPKLEQLRDQWVKFCKMEPQHVLLWHRLCSAHFTENDFSKTEQRMRLKKNAVPSVMPCRKNKKSVATVTPTVKVEPVSDENSMTQLDGKIDNVIDMGAKTTTTITEAVTSECRPGCTKVIRFFEPRYIGDLTEEHVTTPQSRRRTISFVKAKFQESQKKILSLQNQNRRLTQKMEALKNIILHLQQKNIINREASEQLTDGVPDNIEQIIEEKIRKRRRQLKYEARKLSIKLTHIRHKYNNAVIFKR